MWDFCMDNIDPYTPQAEVRYDCEIDKRRAIKRGWEKEERKASEREEQCVGWLVGKFGPARGRGVDGRQCFGDGEGEKRWFKKEVVGEVFLRRGR